MVILVWLLLGSLMAFRLAELLVVDDGPFDVFVSLRGWANRAPRDNGIRRNLANVLECAHCAGLWISISIGIVFYFESSPSVSFIEAVLLAFSIAGLQSILANKVGRT